METEPLVLVVDDDFAVRDSLEELISSAGLYVRTFASAREFLAGYDGRRPACLVLDMLMPDMNGLELQQKLHLEQSDLPVVVVTGHGDVPTAARSFKLGAVEFLEKPFKEAELLAAVQTALQRDTELQRAKSRHDEIASRIAKLSAREQQVMESVVAGKPNKCIAVELGITQRTVEVHRAHIMKKMQADSLPELVRLVLTFSGEHTHLDGLRKAPL